MPFIGRFPRYPIYPQTGGDPTENQNIFGMLAQMTIAPLTTANIELRTGNTSLKIADFDINFLDGMIDYSIIEDPTLVVGTQEIFIGNADRTSSVVSTARAFSNPTAISGGTMLTALTHFGEDLDIVNAGGQEFKLLDFVSLKTNVSYIFQFKNPDPLITVTNLHFGILWAE